MPFCSSKRLWFSKPSVAKVLAWTLLITLSGSIGSFGQPPGTLPPEKVFSESDEKIEVRGFMFLNEAKSKVMMPSVTWEEYERRMNLDSGTDGQRQPFGYQSLEIVGTSDGGRAEMEVTLKLSIESTGGRWVKIPLRMGNFHELSPPDVSGVDEFSITIEPDSSGYALYVKTTAVAEAMVRIRVSSRVETQTTRSIEFRLPDVPSRVRMTVDADRVDGEVIGRGDEVIQTDSTLGNRTTFSIESGGGNFTLRWGGLSRSIENAPLLEVESRFDVRWDSPQDQPIASVRLTIRNTKGSIESFQLRLPAGSVVLDTPRLGTGGQTIELSIPATPSSTQQTSESEIRTVTIPVEERQQRIDLNFDLQLAADNTSPSSPLAFRVVEVIGSLRHRGEIVIQTGGDYRLRWRTRPWVRSEPAGNPDEASSVRLYRFGFDRGSFELPMWLSAKERQLRITSTSEVSIRDGVAALTMDLQAGGQATDGRLQLDEAGWKVSSIENVETGEAIDSFRSDNLRVIDFNLGSSQSTTAIRVRAEQAIDEEIGNIEFAIPRVVVADENVLVQNAFLNLISSGRSMLVVDLTTSQGLTRVASTNNDNVGTTSISTFRMLSPDTTAVVVGTLVDQPPRITLSSDATIELDGDQLRSTVDWIVTSPLDLEGRLPIRIPEPTITSNGSSATKSGDILIDGPSDLSAAIGKSSSGLERFDGIFSSSAEPWIVTVDGVPATLRILDDDRLELISERLSSGTMAIRWRHTQLRRSSVNVRSIESVSLPRPNIADVTTRGVMRVNLRGNQQYDLTSVGSTPEAVSVLELDSLPREPVRLRLQSRTVTLEDISIRQAVLRTVVGRTTRQEQVIANIQGGDLFQVDLPTGTPDVSVEAFLDDQSVPVQRQADALVIPLSGDRRNHVIDIRVWLTSSTAPSFATIRPLLKLPVGVGRVYWQIIAPSDSHIVWASPTVGRSMTWRFDGWKLYRAPSHSDAALNAMVGGYTDSMDTPPGNRYLYVGSDVPSFEVMVVSRAVLWICTGSFVLALAVVLTYIPKSRHPLTAVVMAILFTGLLATAPDAAVLAGQFGMISLVLVIVMIAIRTLISPQTGGRVFASPKTQSESKPSTRSIRPATQNVDPSPALSLPGAPDVPSITTTQVMPPNREVSS